ncbi:MAG: UvrD-helicase domain-containing protein, partial [Acidimicrobiales bacterium]
MTVLDLSAPLPEGRTLVEASAGTGKTYSIAALVARFVAGDLAGHSVTEGVGIDEILVVTYTRAAASELRDRVRGKLRLAADYLEGLDGAPPPDGDEWLQVFDAGTHRVRRRRAARLHDAIARFDEATITTIHGFCQQALAQCGLRTGAAAATELIENDRALVAEVCRDLLLHRLADDPLAMSTDQSNRPLVAGQPGAAPVAARQPRPPGSVERYLIETVRAVLSNPGARCEPSTAAGGVAGGWASVVAAAVDEVAARQRARRQVGYDRLISDLANLLADPAGGRQLADQLAYRYRLVLVDEFQDTDRLQWEIFENAFARHRLITVGDPKQAIYRFRGADVHAYLAAVRRADRVTLRTNHRSDRQLLDALAVLFDGARLGHADIEFSRVDASPRAPLNALGRDAALHLRVVPDDAAIAHTSQGLEAGAVARIVLTDVASRIRTLLDTATIRVGRSSRRVQPCDIGVLVPSQRRASEAAAVLRDWGIPSVRARTGSVLHTEAARQWRLLLAGLALPSRAGVARAAGLSWFFDIPPSDLVDRPDQLVAHGHREPALAVLQRRLATLADDLRTFGVGAFYEHLRAESTLLGVTLGRPQGGRDLADLDHIAELLVTALRGMTCDAARVAETLERMIADADDQSEATMRRIETDDDAVHVTTVHSAKGLEYPIVLVPFAYAERPRTDRPYVFNVDGQRVVDVASWVAWGDGVAEGGREAIGAMNERRRLARNEIDGDGLRLLYVALTRAKHRVEAWWAPLKGAPTSALGRLLLDRWGAGPVFNSEPGSAFERSSAEQASAQIDAIVAASNGTIARHDVPLEQPIRRPLPLSEPPPRLLAVADGSARHPLTDQARRSWSFTSIAELAAAEVARADDRPLEHGGADEPTDAGDGELPLADPTAGAATAAEMPLAGAPGGTTFGTIVHHALELTDFTSSTLAADTASSVAAASRRAGLALDTPTIADGIVAAIDTPLGPLFGGSSLRHIAPRDRLAELTFDLAFGAARLNAGRVGDILAETLDRDDPLLPYAAELAAGLRRVELAGWLTGSIDAVFRLDSSDHERFVIVDYKSNRLHDPGAADPLASYRPDRLVPAMVHGDYPLQAVLYGVALHRYL